MRPLRQWFQQVPFNQLGLKYRFILLTITGMVMTILIGGIFLHTVFTLNNHQYEPQYLFYTALFFVLIGIVAILLISKYMIHPVVNLTQKIDEVRRGNLNVDITPIPNRAWQDEMDQLYEGFAHMLQALKANIQALTEAKEKAESVSRELYKSNQRLETIFNSISDGIMIIDRDFKIVGANPVILKLMGKSKEEIIGQPCYQMCNGTLRRCNFCRASLTFRHGDHEFTYCTKTDPVHNKQRILEVHDFPLYDENGEIIQIIEYVKDVTDAMQMQANLERARRLAEIGEMAAKVAHEVRNPLNAIKGATHYLKGEIGNTHYQSYLDLIEDQVERVNHVATTLLNLARPLKPEFQPADLREVLQRALVDTREAIMEKAIHVVIDVTEDLPTIPVDENQIEQALVNIILNAVDAMDEGGELHFEFARKTGRGCDEPEYIELAIRDTGRGIPEDIQEQIFQPFFTTKTKGTGLGLTIVKKIIDHHQGNIQLTSVPEQGTVVTIQLPLTRVNHETQIYSFSS